MDKLFPSISGYRVLSQLGEGGMGAVYLAEDETLDRKVAIKVISKRILNLPGAGARFQREAKTMATLEHANIVRVYAFGHSEEQSFLIMEYVDGDVLSQLIRKSGGLTIDEALNIAKQIVDALEAAWEKKIVHRDIKPANVLIDRRQQVRVGDFGLAKPLNTGEDTLTQEGSVLGTPHYVSPEQALGRELDYRSDVYSLGIVLYEMLAGAPPFQGNTPFDIVRKHLSDPLPLLKEKRPDVPDRLIELLEWMTKKDPHERPTYPQLQHEFKSLLGGDVSSMPTSGPQRRMTITGEKSPLFRRGAMAAVIVAILVAIAAWRASRPATPKEKGISTPASLLVVAVAPFYGPDPDSQQEGRVMAALMEKAVSDRLKEDAKVIGQEETQTIVRDHHSAQELGKKLGANAVIWGEVLSLRKETEVQPHFTLIRNDPEEQPGWQTTNVLEDPLVALSERTAHPVILPAEASNQIELRKTTAAGIGEIVVLLAGINSLYREDNAAKALRYFSETSRTPESLYYRAVALLRQEKAPEALTLLQEALTLDPNHSASHALLGDQYLLAESPQQALSSYAAAWKSGNSYTSHRGFVYEDRFYESEILKSSRYTGGNPFATPHLLEEDPATGKVLRRYSLPGIPDQFRVDRNGVEISYDSGSGLENHVILSNGKFDRVLDLPEDPLLRLQSMQASWAVAANFMDGLESTDFVETAKFAPTGSSEDAPQTFDNLKTVLQSDWEKDETQPWTLFFLGQISWAQGKREEAEEIWQQIFVRPFDSIPYYDFAWMASFFEKLKQPDWADRSYVEALKRRKTLSVPVSDCSLIERVVNTGFIQQAALSSQHGVDLLRSHTWLERARELSGISFDGDDFAAAAWKKYLKQQGKSEMAAHEQKIFRKAQHHPFNLIRSTTHLDYAFYILGACTLGFLISMMLILKRAAQESILPERFVVALSPKEFGRLVQFLLLAAVAALPVIWLYQARNIELTIAFALVAVIVGGFLLRVKTTPARLIGAIPLEGRIVLAIAYFLFFASLIVAISGNYEVQSILNRPHRISDVAASPMLVYEMEEKLKENDNDQIRLITAIANHLSGNRERAEHLYQMLPGNMQAQKNLVALRNNVFPPPVLVSDDQIHASMTISRKSWLTHLWYPGQSLNIFLLDAGAQSNFNEDLDGLSFVLRILMLMGAALILFFFLIPYREEQTTKDKERVSPGLAGKISFFLLPGSFHLLRSSFWRGYVALTCFLIMVVSTLTIWLIPSRFPLPGVVTLLQMPNFLSSLPFPTAPGLTDQDAITSYHYWTIFWTYAHARLFWGIVLAAGVVSGVVHILSFRRIVRS